MRKRGLFAVMGWFGSMEVHAEPVVPSSFIQRGNAIRVTLLMVFDRVDLFGVRGDPTDVTNCRHDALFPRPRDGERFPA
jgi:hypothetical protein